MLRRSQRRRTLPEPSPPSEEEEEAMDISADELEEEDEISDTSEPDPWGEAVDALDAEPPKAAPSKLKIKLKLTVRTPIETPAVSTPDLEAESEDEFDDDDETPGPSNHPLTARQAAKRGVVDPSHVSLDTEAALRSKKKQLNETELALKREETARKRKNLSEKKLEDEKMETINRLLRKQSKARGRRNALATAEDAEADVDDADDVPPELPAPLMYRWVSTSRGADDAGNQMEVDEKRMRISFGVPLCALPPPPEMDAPTLGGDAPTVDGEKPKPTPPVDRGEPVCGVSGCGAPRKYRLVRDWRRGACGMDHLRVLQAV